jgi:cytosine/uracil/thiamine/allantoin permease
VYQYAWFVTFGLSLLIYSILMRGRVALPANSSSRAPLTAGA